MEGTGTNSNPQSYRFETEDLGPGTHTLRLRQIDTDGTVHLSKEVSTEIQKQEKLLLTAPVPNPVASAARLTFCGEGAGEGDGNCLQHARSAGRHALRGAPDAGEQVSIQLNASALGAGRISFS